MKGKKFCLKNNENINILLYFSSRYFLKVVNKIIFKIGELRILFIILLLICVYIFLFLRKRK